MWDRPEVYAIRAEILRCLGSFEKAYDLADLAIRLQPYEPSHHTLMAAIESELGLFPQALASYYRGNITSDSSYRVGLLNERIGNFALARTAYAAAIDLDRDNAVAKTSLGYIHLILGDYQTGWELFEARWRGWDSLVEHGRAQQVPETEPHILDNPRWNGEHDKVVCVYAEQGLGDTIHFVRYAKKLMLQYGCKIYLEVQSPLVKLLTDPLYYARVFAAYSAPPNDIEYVIPMMSLPLALGLNTVEQLSEDRPPYIAGNGEMMLRWDGKLRIGVCWAGGQRIDSFNLLSPYKGRDIPLSELACLADLDATFVSLQYGYQALQAVGSPLNFTDPMANVKDFYDLAAIIATLDVVVTIDTGLAHLAGAMGKDVFLLCSWYPCWRWANERNKSICYPNFRLFRQTEHGDWSAPVQAVKSALQSISLPKPGVLSPRRAQD